MQEHGPSVLPSALPDFPDHWAGIEEATMEFPFRLVTAPSRHFLNSSFNETPTSVRREQRPTVLVHPQDAKENGIKEGDRVTIGNARGEVELHAKIHMGQRRGVLVSESIWPNGAFSSATGINTLTGADPVAPSGGAAFHDNRVWLRSTSL